MTEKNNHKSTPTIPEEVFIKDFKPMAGFYDFHVKKRKIKLSLKDLNVMGVELKPKKQMKIAEVILEEMPLNTIVFSSSKKSQNVKNLMWTFRCLTAHPENIEIVTIGGREYYKIICWKKQKDSNIPIMKGIVSSNEWPMFIDRIQSSIIKVEDKDNEKDNTISHE